MKNNVYKTLTTPYIDKMDKESPWADYPRPSMVRSSYLCLNGYWDFSITSKNAVAEYNEKILVPFPPESLLSGIEREVPSGSLLHYKKTVKLPEDFIGKTLLLHFGAIDTIADIFINGELALHHEGGYIPFTVKLQDIKDEFLLEVRVIDDLDTDYPYGKQTRKRGGMWYTPVSGIWQSVWLEAVPDSYIERLKITPTLRSVKIEVFGGEDKKRLTLLSDGKSYEFSGNTITLTPDDPKFWSPEDPYIYRFSLESGEDRIESYFALREIGIKEYDGIPRLTLNGAPYLFSALLDQGYFPDGIFLPPTSEGYEDDILRAKALGFNTLRKHIKVEPEIFYYLCDSLGIVVFQDMVNNSGYNFFFDTVLPTIGLKKIPDKHLHPSKKSREIFEKSMYEIFDHLYNFPSILYYTIFNEGWGQFSADEMYKKAKDYEKTRIIDATSGWFTESLSDVDSRHVYFKRIKVSRKPKKPLVISEFGGYSHRVEGHLFGKDNYGYRLFEKRCDFEEAFESLYKDEVLPLIDKGISALVYTQISDVEDETNGLITYDRRVVKLDIEKTNELMHKLYDETSKLTNI